MFILVVLVVIVFIFVVVRVLKILIPAVTERIVTELQTYTLSFYITFRCFGFIGPFEFLPT